MHFSNATRCGEAFTIIGTLRSEALGTAIENLNLEVSNTRFGTSEIQFSEPIRPPNDHISVYDTHILIIFGSYFTPDTHIRAHDTYIAGGRRRNLQNQ